LPGWLSSRITRIVFEPTGPHHHAFERQPAEAGLPLAKVNPRQARRFAEAVGCHAKTDAVDAAMLARLAALLEPPVRAVVSPVLDDMKELSVARRALVKDQEAALQCDGALRSTLLKRFRHFPNGTIAAQPRPLTGANSPQISLFGLNSE
jgi:transposase